MYNLKIWYLGMSYCKEYFNCDKFVWQSDKIITFMVDKTKHIVPLYNVDDVELIEINGG